MKKILALAAIAALAIGFTGCAFNAKDEVPGTSWKAATITIADTNTGFSASCTITGYNSKKDVQFSVNPQTHSATLGSVMNPSNTVAAASAIGAQGNANTSQITATGAAAQQIISALGNSTGQAAAAGLKP